MIVPILQVGRVRPEVTSEWEENDKTEKELGRNLGPNSLCDFVQTFHLVWIPSLSSGTEPDQRLFSLLFSTHEHACSPLPPGSSRMTPGTVIM